MSRFTKRLEEGVTVAYGYDKALGYFIDVFKRSEDPKTEDEIILEKCNMFGSSNGDILEVMEKYEANPDHIRAVGLDLKF
tara:strand:+ start:376 stop:615 length:240 start_codon:yes stop_codon:yes gene_type:complete